MNRFFSLLLGFTLTAIATNAQKATDLNKAVVNVITYNGEGKIIGNAYGFYAGATGEVIAPYEPFRGAVRADIINWQGQTATAQRIIGASSAYDLVRFSTDAPLKKLVGLELATTHAVKDQQLQVAYYTTDKKAAPVATTITAADLYNNHYYYETTTANENQFFGCPVLNTEGKAVALVQKNVQKDATTACAIDINFAAELSTQAVSAFDKDLNEILIPKQIPADNEEAAFSYVFMQLHSQTDPNMALTAASDFINAYPMNTRIYGERATFYANQGDYALADSDLQKAISMGGDNLSEAYHALSLLMYNKVLAHPATAADGTPADDPYPAWTMQTALQNVQQAYSSNPLPIYLHQEGNVLLALEQYREAYEKYMAYNEAAPSSQGYYQAAKALQAAGGENAEVLALMDSVVNLQPTPYTAEAAPYLIERASLLSDAGQHRRATKDYNEYEKLVGTRNLNAYFYYLRMQSEIGSHMYQQALDDAATAISRATTAQEKGEYQFERGCLYLRLNMKAEAREDLQNAAAQNVEGAAEILQKIK